MAADQAAGQAAAQAPGRSTHQCRALRVGGSLSGDDEEALEVIEQDTGPQVAEAGPQVGVDQVDTTGLYGGDRLEQRRGRDLVLESAGDVVVADGDHQRPR